jgi:cytoskeletal protein CcmA (bactofilin family)
MTAAERSARRENFMFGKKSQPLIRTLIGEGTIIRGEVRFADGLRIDGEVQGDINAVGENPSILVISEKATVTPHHHQWERYRARGL